VGVEQQPSDSLESEFASTLITQIFDLWVGPELKRRSLALTRADIRQVVVEMDPDKPLRVLINDEAKIVGRAVAKRELTNGEEVASSDIGEISGVRPFEIGPNSGWICFVRFGHQEIVAFDFTYNRARAAALLDRAREFLAAATHAGDTAPGVAIDNAHSAAELAVQAQMLVQQTETRNHRERREWLAAWAEHENAPQHHADILWNLAALREPARYGSGKLQLKPGRLAKILKTVQEMIDFTAARVNKKPS
jgi:hypothetical protein